MGCVESQEGHPDVEEDTSQAYRAATSAPEKQRKKKKKISLQKKSAHQKKGVDAQKSDVTSRSESTKVTVIWRRWSVFSNTHESFNKRLEGEAAGPSGGLAQTSQISNLSAERML